MGETTPMCIKAEKKEKAAAEKWHYKQETIIWMTANESQTVEVTGQGTTSLRD